MRWNVHVLSPAVAGSSDVYTVTVDGSMFTFPASEGFDAVLWCSEIAIDRTGTYPDYAASPVWESQVLVTSSGAAMAPAVGLPSVLFTLCVILFVYCFFFVFRSVR